MLHLVHRLCLIPVFGAALDLSSGKCAPLPLLNMTQIQKSIEHINFNFLLIISTQCTGSEYLKHSMIYPHH